jgi:hypothetical protein
MVLAAEQFRSALAQRRCQAALLLAQVAAARAAPNHDRRW